MGAAIPPESESESVCPIPVEVLSVQRIYQDLLDNREALLRASASADHATASAAMQGVIAPFELAAAWTAQEKVAIWPRLMMASSANFRASASWKAHQQTLAEAMAAIAAVIAIWRDDPRLYGDVLAVLDEYEQTLINSLEFFAHVAYPLCKGVIADEDWLTMTARVLANIEPAQRLTAFGLLLATKSPEARAVLIAAVDASLRDAWESGGSAAFERQQALLR